MGLPRRPFRALLAGLAVLALVLAAGCGTGDGDDATATSDDAVAVVATTAVLGDLARVVGGDAAAVTQLLRPGTDPHTYEPRPSDVAETARAAVVLESGLGLDAWVDEVVEQSGGDPRVVDVGAAVPIHRDGEHSHEHDGEHDDEALDHGDIDPHWWHDPRNVIAAVETIRDALTAANPAGAQTYATNAATYTRRVRALDRGIQACIATIPRADRKLVTDHDAFGYFADRYGLELVGTVIPSLTTQAQPSAGDLAALVRTIEREGVKAVFPEISANRKLADAIARETGATSAYALLGDALGEAGTPASTYLGMTRQNADAIVRGLTHGLTGTTRACKIPGPDTER